jgi:hypothetical protein
MNFLRRRCNKAAPGRGTPKKSLYLRLADLVKIEIGNLKSEIGNVSGTPAGIRPPNQQIMKYT